VDRVLFLLMTSLLFSSCSQLVFESHGKLTVRPMKRYSDTQRVEVTGRRVFYLWGNIPTIYRVNLDEELEKFVGSEVSGVRIDQFIEPIDLFASIVSLGFYFPRSYRIIAYRRRWSDEH
jgi:hypothetical protein